MDKDTAEAVAAFVARQYRAHPSRCTVELEWFGGKPTLNPAVIHTIADRLRQEQIPFRSAITTNGLLLTETLLQYAAAWNLRGIQITLDAADGEYEAIKGLPSGSFEKVLDNLDCCLSSGIDVVIRINYGGNQRQITALLERLAQRYSGRQEKPQISLSTLYGEETSIPAECMRDVMALNDILIRSGLADFGKVYDLRERDRCFAATPWGFTVMPDGTLVNCSHNASDENSFGTVWQYDEQNSLHRQFLSGNLSPECRACSLLPVCGGGCPAAQHRIAQMHRCIPWRNVIGEILEKQLAYLLS